MLPPIALYLPLLVASESSRDEEPFREEGGAAHMEPDGTIVLDIRLTRSDGSVADEQVGFLPANPHYRELLERPGGLKPGESKVLPPWTR